MDYQYHYLKIRAWYDSVREEIHQEEVKGSMTVLRMAEVNQECYKIRKEFYFEMMMHDHHPANNSRAKEIINLFDCIQFDMLKISGVLE